jgi:hypothetical protein
MSRNLAFWIIYLITLLGAIVYPFWPLGWPIWPMMWLMMILMALMGWQVFGAPLH